jgi:hypothetical protein
MRLPPTVDSIEQLSLQAHFALTAFSLGEGNKHLLVELFRVLYMSWFLKKAGVGDAETPLYVRCNKILEDVVTTARRESSWTIPHSDGSILQRLQSSYDAQIAQAPMFLMERCQRQLQTHLRTQSGTPWSSVWMRSKMSIGA